MDCNIKIFSDNITDILNKHIKERIVILDCGYKASYKYIGSKKCVVDMIYTCDGFCVMHLNNSENISGLLKIQDILIEVWNSLMIDENLFEYYEVYKNGILISHEPVGKCIKCSKHSSPIIGGICLKCNDISGEVQTKYISEKLPSQTFYSTGNYAEYKGKKIPITVIPQ